VKPKRTLGIGLAVAVALLVSACAAGRQAATANQKNTLDGVNADLGMIHIRAMVVDAPTLFYKAGESATVKVVLVNTSRTQSDLLTSITSPAVSDWGAFNTTAEAGAVLAADASKSSSASASPLPSPGHQILIRAGTRTSYGTPESTGALVFLQFTRDVYPGTTIPVTLRFAQAGTITISVPIALSNSTNTSPIATPSGIEG
jgi:periplasmic copper chaperone A